ncbi:MAG: SEC-C metal-binding domain-containing protein [Sedimentisphaerales bacterium]|nr:SEC-C metal-binding domain-containing protein [Sedimentisphaerales bacterium]
MEDKTAQLPWEALKKTEGGIPWSALYEFAAAVVNDQFNVGALIELYEQALISGCDHEHYEEFYIPAILALAAPHLSDRRRYEIGTFLVEELSEAGQEDDDLLMEVLTAACGSMGPGILSIVLDAIAKEPNHEGAWFHLWGLMAIVAKSEDIELRGRVIQACMDLLTQADRGEIEPFDAINAAWILAAMKYTECSKLLKRLKKKAVKCFCHGDYVDALKLLEGRLDYTPLPNTWEKPVKEWFEPRWKIAKEWYTKEHSREFEDGERWAGELTDRFMVSEAASELDIEFFEDAGFIVYHVLEYAWSYVGSSPEELDEFTLEEVLLEIFPYKVTAERELFEKVAPVTEFFLKWLESEGILANTAGLIEAVHGWTDKIVAKGMNTQYWGMAKSFMMQARVDGIDTRDEQAMQRYMAEYNLRLLERDSSAQADLRSLSPPVPIVEQSPKIGRNAPCPCGSGRKYKKCCGGIKSASVNR